jgi:hypothetical protein
VINKRDALRVQNYNTAKNSKVEDPAEGKTDVTKVLTWLAKNTSNTFFVYQCNLLQEEILDFQEIHDTMSDTVYMYI